MSSCYGFPTTQTAVLQAVVAKIQANIPYFNGNNLCFLSDQPSPYERQQICCVVSPGAGNYASPMDEPLWAGADPRHGIVERSTVIVTVWNEMNLDRNDEMTELLTNAERGMLYWKRLILKALLTTGDLLDTSGNNILIQPMRPKDANAVATDNKWSEMHIDFEAIFSWDLAS